MLRLVLYLLSFFGLSSSPPVHPDTGGGDDPNG